MANNVLSDEKVSEYTGPKSHLWSKVTGSLFPALLHLHFYIMSQAKQNCPVWARTFPRGGMVSILLEVKNTRVMVDVFRLFFHS